MKWLVIKKKTKEEFQSTFIYQDAPIQNYTQKMN